MVIDAARADDAPQAADLAAAKRAEYERYSPVFWRVADGARERHEPFLAQCIESGAFTSFAARDGDELRGIVIASHRAFPPPFRDDPEPTWLVDDFFVRSPASWPTVGAALLARVEDAAAAGGAERVVVVAARRDEPKTSFLRARAYELAAEWWVHAVVPKPEEPKPLGRVRAVVGPAPPVYDPGGLTALALALPDPDDVAAFERWASASSAVLAIVPLRTPDAALAEALSRRGYDVASQWFARPPT
jgi:GNAT superfamily N-acetyltransferase